MSTGVKADVRGIVAAMGGRTHLARRISAVSSAKLTPKAIDKWYERGEIPGSRLDIIMALAEIAGNRDRIRGMIR
jgi:hypothetical protein